MRKTLAHSGYLAAASLRNLARQPWYIAVSLVQPVFWLLLFGALFKKVTEIPGFTTASYIDYLTPGIVVMTALFSSGWSGMGILEAVDRGVMDRYLVTPVRRIALIAGPIAQQIVTVITQSVIILGVAFALGAHFRGGVAGVLTLLAAVVLLSATFAAVSNAIALLLRKEESLIATVQFVVLPCTFLSTALMPHDLVPGWITTVSRVNPVNWAVEAGRAAMETGPDWGAVSAHAGYLLALTVVTVLWAVRAFRSYQRSL